MLTPKYSHAAGPRNWYGDGSDGHIRITTAGPAQSPDGIVWSAIPGWLSSGDTAMIPSIEDGDMVTVNAISLTIDAGMVLTTSHRCRGLLVYVQQSATVNGTISMTARGPHANPADAATSEHTPVPPTDGHAVPPEGITIRRLAAGHNHTHTGTMMYGCGVAAVAAEANQPDVVGDGIVITIPRIGGAGGHSTDGTAVAGGVAPLGPGGGGSGASYVPQAGNYAGDGAAATCYAGGAGGGGLYGVDNAHQMSAGQPYGGAGGDGDDYLAPQFGGGGGAGNPGGRSDNVASGGDGVGGLLIIIARRVDGTGVVSANGSPGGPAYSTIRAGGGSSGGGVCVVLSSVPTPGITVEALGGPSVASGGAGGDGYAQIYTID